MKRINPFVLQFSYGYNESIGGYQKINTYYFQTGYQLYDNGNEVSIEKKKN